VLRRIRYFFEDLAYFARRQPLGFLRMVGGVLVACALIAGVYVAARELLEDDEPEAPALAPEIFVRTGSAPEETEDIGFPTFATRNTTRIAGADSIAIAAGAALATFPTDAPPAVALADVGDWPGALAASVLFADPVSAPLLFTADGEVPELTADALAALDPRGSAATGRDQAFVIGDAAAPDDLRTDQVTGGNPAELALAIATLRTELAGEDPDHLLVVSSDDPEYAMPAAAWAARSGDPILFAQRDSVPAATIDAIERWEEAEVFVLGPESVISDGALRRLRRAASNVRRVGEEGPVENAVAFARYVRGEFGWNINDPGHGFVVANTARPTDAAAAAPLSASGSWGPLLLTDSAETAPPALAGYLLDLKPGYETDPTRAVFNHLWIIGDEASISTALQAELDEIAELAPVRSGEGESFLGPDAGAPEPETRAD
jgi:hypothetical protein